MALQMFSPRFQFVGYAVSFQGFLKAVKKSDAIVEIDYVETSTTPFVSGTPSVCTPGKSEGAETKKTKILQDDEGEYLQWGRAKHCPKWRPWNGEPIPYREMSADSEGFWPK
jgi:hypothetical protein